MTRCTARAARGAHAVAHRAGGDAPRYAGPAAGAGNGGGDAGGGGHLRAERDRSTGGGAGTAGTGPGPGMERDTMSLAGRIDRLGAAWAPRCRLEEIGVVCGLVLWIQLA